MSFARTRRRRALALLVASGAALAVAASPADAGVEHYCAGSLLAKWSCTGSTLVTGSIYVEIITNHTGCAGIGVPSIGPGYYDNPTLFYQWQSFACTSGSGTNGAHSTIASGYSDRGGVYDPNNSTTDYVYDAHVSW